MTRLIIAALLIAGSARAQTGLCPERSDGTFSCNAKAIPPGQTYIGTTMPAPAFQAQLDRIEGMLKAICEHVGFGGHPDCPKETKP